MCSCAKAKKTTSGNVNTKWILTDRDGERHTFDSAKEAYGKRAEIGGKVRTETQ